MKIIDNTPLQDEKGEISFVARIQGTLKYGLNWFAELEAQKVVITQLDRLLEKGFILIRNFTLPNSDIVIPLILIGTGGVYIIYVTPLKGHFEAKGDQWNTVNNTGRSQPASINLMDRLSRLTTVFQKYLKIHGIELQTPVEAVLIAVDSGVQIDSVRPVARVVRSDAIKQFASSLLQARPLWNVDFVHVLADRIIDPAPPAEPVVAAPAPSEPSRASFSDSESAPSFDTQEFGFSFEESDESSASQPATQDSRQPGPARQLPRPRPAVGKKKLLGMSNTQIMVLAGMFIFWCCIMIGFIAFITFTQ